MFVDIFSFLLAAVSASVAVICRWRFTVWKSSRAVVFRNAGDVDQLLLKCNFYFKF